jgi:hypothetical protein
MRVLLRFNLFNRRHFFISAVKHGHTRGSDPWTTIDTLVPQR